MITVAVIGMGQMGAGIAGRLVERGAHVLTSLDGRSTASVVRARSAGVETTGDEELVERAEMLLSIVPPAVAAGVALRYLPLIAGAREKPVFAECNAIAPATLHDIAPRFLDMGLSFVDACIIGPPPTDGTLGPRLYLAGPRSADVERLRAFDLDVRVISETLGDASALKMCFAGINKGFQALGTAVLLASAREGNVGALAAELRYSHPEIYGWLSRRLLAMLPRAHRWAAEMREIAFFLDGQQGGATMFLGAGDLYDYVAEDVGAADRSVIASVFAAFANQK